MNTMTTRKICQLTPMAAFAGVADQVTDECVVDDALQAGHDVLQHRRPRQLPDRGADGTFDERSVERRGFLAGAGADIGTVILQSAASRVEASAPAQRCRESSTRQWSADAPAGDATTNAQITAASSIADHDDERDRSQRPHQRG